MSEKRERSGRQECKLLKLDQFKFWSHYIGEPKIDGIGVIFLVKDGIAQGLSTTQLPLQNVSHICRQLEKFAARYPDWNNSFFDGEVLMSGMDQPEAQNVTSGLVQKLEYDSRSENIHFHIWDTLLIGEYEDRACELTYEERKKVLECLFNQISGEENKLFHQITGKEFSTKEEFLTVFNNFVSKGHEGIVLKHKDSYYTYSKSWYKYKPHQEGDFLITGAVEGKGRLTGSLGKLLVEGWLQPDGNISPVKKAKTDILIKAKPATFTDSIGKSLWKDYLDGKLVGVVVEVKHEGITKNNSLKFAKYIRLRNDKKGN